MDDPSRQPARPGAGRRARVRGPGARDRAGQPVERQGRVPGVLVGPGEPELSPELVHLPRQAGAPPARLGFDGMWIPSPAKGASGGFSMGYDPFDHYDLGDKDQRGTLATKFGTKDELLRLIAVAHANGLDAYPDIVLNHMNGGAEDPRPAVTNSSASSTRVRRRRRAAGRRANDFSTERRARMHGRRHLRRVLRRPGRSAISTPSTAAVAGPVHARSGAGVDGLADQAALDADGYRFDAVKHLPAYVVEDVLFHAQGWRHRVLLRGEYVVGKGEKEPIDQWAAATQNRCGTFDFSYRTALLDMIGGGGFFDMGGLPNFQQGTTQDRAVHQQSRHLAWPVPRLECRQRAVAHDRSGRSARGRRLRRRVRDRRQPGGLLRGPDRHFGEDRRRQDPDDLRLRDYLVNLIWAHQKPTSRTVTIVRLPGLRLIFVLERAARR